MEPEISTIELSGVVNRDHQIDLDKPLPIESDTRVRVIVLYSSEEGFSESEWLQNAAENEPFEFLKDEAEDIYTLDDGLPITDET